MLILFDNGTPAPLRHALNGHTVVEAIERGWDRLVNGELIAAAEEAGFDLLLTTDKTCVINKTLKAAKSPLWFSATSSGPLYAAMSTE
jgi:alkanesulfonate monooxygenase SsuD/methylene tetrahydromethanopterin reductase-like flavin-dependent oxidoreductase (luciferase family)